jgi:hypothetical protein
MSVQYRVASAVSLALTCALGSACRGNSGAGGIGETDTSKQREAGMVVFGDSQVVAALKGPQGPGHIIYDPPTDLSLANAMRTRPDMFRPDTARTGTRRDSRDSTGGDATADTSGGAARRRRP